MPKAPIELLDLRDLDRPDLLNAFIAIYRASFPDPSEREDPAQWSERLHRTFPSPQPRTHLLIALDTQAQTTPAVRGGIVFEYYPASRCGLLTYLAVEPVWRRRGLGRRLVKAATEILKRDAEDRESALRAVFAEAEDPAKVARGATMAPHARMTALTRMGALWIDIPYVQPQLQGGSGPCRHLLLLTFYHDGRQPVRIDGAVVRDFLHEFYRALGIQRPEIDADYAEASRQLGNMLPLKPYPLTTTE